MNAPQEQMQQNRVQADDEIDLLALVGILLDYKWLIAAVIGVFALLGVIYALLAAPVYQADALLQIEAKESGLSGVADLSELAGKEPEANAEIELIKSRWVIGKVVDSLKLDVTAAPLHLPLVGNFFARRFSPGKEGTIASPMLPFTGKYNWGGAEIRVAQLDMPESGLGKPFTLIAGENGVYELQGNGGVTLLTGSVGQLASGQGVSLLVERLHANPGQHFQLVRLPKLAVINKFRTSLQVAERGRGTGIINMSLESTSATLAKTVLNEVAQQYVRQNVERKSEEAANSLQFVREQLPKVREEMNRATAALNQYQVNSKSVDITAETSGVLQQIVELETSISEFEMKKLEMDKRFTPAHPAYQTAMQQLRDLQARKKILEEKVGNLPATQQELLRLARDVQVSTEIYALLQNRSQELDIIRAGTVGNARIIDLAEAGAAPVKPQRTLVVLIATLLGAIVGVVIVGAHAALTRGIEEPGDIEALGLAVSATIPFSVLQEEIDKAIEQGSNASLLVLTHPTDPSIEAIRSLRTSLHFMLMEASNNVMAISGPSPQVGKSFISANMAVTMAQAGKKVLLIDADMRKGYLQRFFGKESSHPGLASLLAKQAGLEEVVVHTEVQGLDFIARGPVQKNPSELLLSPLFGQLVKHFSANYDVVIIDTPPILAVADALIVSKLAGLNFIVTRFSKNPLGEIQATIRRFENSGIKLTGAILNATQKRSLAYYGYKKYGYGNYQYDYYGVDDKKSRRSKKNS